MDALARCLLALGCVVAAATAAAQTPGPEPAVPGSLRIPVAGVSRAALPAGDFASPRGAEGAERHAAIDIAAPRGTPVVAVEDGTIAKLFESEAGGRTVYQFDPTGRLVYYYAHLDGYAPELAEGMPVVRGQTLGVVGTTGNAPDDAPHLHFAIHRLGEAREWWQGEAIDPFPYLLEGGARAADALGLYGTTAALEAARAQLAAAQESGGWPAVGAGPTLERDATGPRVQQLRARLAAGGDLEADAAAAAGAAPFDEPLERAVRRFQLRHGLAPDGRVGPATRAALDVPPGRRAEQAAANLEARRRLESALEPRFVLVNVPDYRLLVVENRATALAMAVAVGRPDWRTPPIDDRIETIVVNPAWNVPASIVEAEVAPRAARDPGYLERNDMVRLAGNRWQQKPGPRNPLGRLKFVFPNHEDIYLHDTPGQAVFARRERSVSHGCLRLDDARALAEHLLRGVPGWDGARLAGVIDSGRTESIPLDPPVPVHIVYWTAWVDDEGRLQLREDLYDEAVDPDTPPLVDPALETPARAQDGDPLPGEGES